MTEPDGLAVPAPLSLRIVAAVCAELGVDVETASEVGLGNASAAVGKLVGKAIEEGHHCGERCAQRRFVSLAREGSGN